MNALMDALMSSDFEGTEEMRSAAMAQSGWYMLEDGYIQGLPTWLWAWANFTAFLFSLEWGWPLSHIRF
ncbi:MAG: hypothetical protein HFI19_03590 [Lachnospiraceae bacterium]|uniref:hypothetical protein n=1 Tax=Candidatus Merdisoma sp. JLR.KK006 TaxID=3112626 RepID=UPI002FF129BC|nr:hypothetical protein [Lachnospiraceae bacterium]